VRTVGSTSAINATVRSLDMSISGELSFSNNHILFFALYWFDKKIHFAYRGSCVLFPQEELDRWEMQMNQRVGRQIVAHAHAAIHGQNGQAHPCPTCRQPSPKVNSYYVQNGTED
jgi:hypothetical protein